MLPKDQILKRCKCGAAEICEPRQHNLLRTMVRIAKLEGPLALYAGLPPTLLMAVPSTALYFTSYEAILRKLKENFSNYNTGSLAIVAGSAARTGATIFFSPLEVIRVQMQAPGNTEPFLRHLRRVVRAGPRQLCSGLGATLARDIPFSAVYWYGIESSKPHLNAWLRIQDPKTKQVMTALGAGIIAGVLATLTTHPFDVVKTRAQTAFYSAHTNGNGRPLTTLQMLQHVWRSEGTRGLSSGLSPRVLKVVPACAIMISSYEAAKIAFNLEQ